ncbi:ribonuclease E/G [Parasulfitobacter algicola]|uniref:Ribonuclease E/G n=1 Tax=Parasulfitobacter algicola TaxID=2614809 RepID=A0ABX2IPH7_9RHOB|nr:ribonuclease E/G [Sulfitobacter algicola]NSX54796.1 ribonuclease E/G [Sulfitobacter algicola]
MKGRLIALDHISGQEAAALMVDGRLEDLLIDTDTAPRPGAIFRAIVDRQIKGQGGVFVKLPDGTGFLRNAKGLRPRQTVLVQVTGYAEAGKATPVTMKVLFKSRYAIITPDAPGLNISRSIRDEDTRDTLLEIAHDAMAGLPYGLILRSSCDGAASDDIAEDIQTMSDLTARVLEHASGTTAERLTDGDGPHLVAWREWGDAEMIETTAGCFEDHGILDQIDAMRTSKVSLRGSGHMFIEPTRALIAVDVNTAGDTSIAAGLKANIAAARDLPRQLRVRGLGGQIVLDLAPLAKKDRRQFETTLRAAFKADLIETSLAGWTPLGHFELQRKRERLPLDDLL